MNHTSKTEEDITRVLTALRDTQAAEGMEGRILRAVEHRTIDRSTWLRWISPTQWSIAALATAAIVLAVSLTTHSNQHPEIDIAQSPDPTTAPTPTPAGQFTIAGVQTPVHRRFAQPPTHPPQKPLCDCDRLAMDEAQAPSHPAPPLPLTRDERILLGAAQRGEPVQVAELEPLQDGVLRAASTPKEDDAFQHVLQRFLKQIAAAEALDPTPAASDFNAPGPPEDSSNAPN